MSKVQREGLEGALSEAQALARVLMAMSGGKLDLQPVVHGRTKHMPALPLSWEAAKTEAWQISKQPQDTRLPVAVQRERNREDIGIQQLAGFGWGDGRETFCATCGPLDHPGIHTQEDCTSYQRQRDL